MITSNRTFGVELELGARDYRDIEELRDRLPMDYRFDDDGSIRHIVPNPIEIVTPVLRGETGENDIRHLCQQLKDLEFNPDYDTCGMHVHLGAEGFKKNTSWVVLTGKEMEKFAHKLGSHSKIHKVYSGLASGCARLYANGHRCRPKTSHYRDIVLKDLPPMNLKRRPVMYNEIETWGERRFATTIHSLVDMEQLRKLDRWQSKENRNISENSTNIFSELEELEQKYRKKLKELYEDKDFRYVVQVENEQNYNNLVRLFLFYLVFDRVFTHMVPANRRGCNRYSMLLSETFTPKEILECKNFDDFEKVWYKKLDKGGVERAKGERYNDSRYHNINFHSMFSRHGTVEFRAHGATISPNKILLWTSLHQRVLDSLLENDISVEQLLDIYSDNLNIRDLANKMLDLISAPDFQRRYVGRLLNYFSKIKI